MNIATDCKQAVFQLTVIASCEVAGVAYGPGDTIHTATKRVADRLVQTGAARMETGLAVEEVIKVLGVEDEVAAQVKPAANRIVRKQAGKAKP